MLIPSSETWSWDNLVSVLVLLDHLPVPSLRGGFSSRPAVGLDRWSISCCVDLNGWMVSHFRDNSVLVPTHFILALLLLLHGVKLNSTEGSHNTGQMKKACSEQQVSGTTEALNCVYTFLSLSFIKLKPNYRWKHIQHRSEGSNQLFTAKCGSLKIIFPT